MNHGTLSVLTQFKIPNSKPKICVYSTDKAIVDLVKEESSVIATLARASSVTSVTDKNDKSIEGWLINVINSHIDVFLDIKDKIDINKEVARLNGTLASRK